MHLSMLIELLLGNWCLKGQLKTRFKDTRISRLKLRKKNMGTEVKKSQKKDIRLKADDPAEEDLKEREAVKRKMRGNLALSTSTVHPLVNLFLRVLSKTQSKDILQAAQKKSNEDYRRAEDNR